MEEIAQLLRETREESEINLEEVSNDLGINIAVLKNIEDGKIGSFKDVFVLKNYIYNYSKYLGLDCDKILDEFNEYLFEYTSKIPIDEIEKTIKDQSKEEEKNISSPYTLAKPADKKWMYIFIYVVLFLLVILAIIWSINQITGEKKNAYIVGYKRK